MLEDLFKLHTDPFATYDNDLGSKLLDRPSGICFEFEAESTCEADRPKQSQFVFAKSVGRDADRSQDATFQVCLATDKVDHSLLNRVVKQAVNREVAAAGVFLGRCQGHPIRTAAIGIRAIGAKGSNFDLTVLTLDTSMYQHDTERFADRAGMLWTKHTADLIGGSAGRNVEIMGLVSHERIPHAPPRKIGGVAGGHKSLHHLLGKLKFDRLGDVQGLVRECREPNARGKSVVIMTEDASVRKDAGRHAVVGIIQEEGHFLVIRRSQLVRAPGLICFPGGGIEPGEDFETAVLREFLEELHLPVRVHQHVWTTQTRWGTRLEWLVCSRDATLAPRPNPDEVAEVMWMGIDQLAQRNDLLGSMPDFIEAVRAGTLPLSIHP
jgi:8-oxo-dGTP diphosphatase